MRQEHESNIRCASVSYVIEDHRTLEDSNSFTGKGHYAAVVPRDVFPFVNQSGNEPLLFDRDGKHSDGSIQVHE